MHQNRINNSKYIWGYGVVWLTFGSVYALLLVVIAEYSWAQAMTEAWLFSFLLMVMGVAEWNIVKYAGLDSASVLNTLVTHLVAAGLLVFALVFGGEKFLFLLFTESNYLYKSSSHYHLYRLAASTLIYLFLAINFYLIIYYEEYRSRNLREVEIDQYLKSAELNMLKSQINPHFIFNSLNSVSSLTLTAPEKAHEMVIQLADFLRYSIRKNADQLVSLKQEIEAMELYLAIERTRYGSRLKVEITCDESSKAAVLPALILQPLIENAIKYSLHETDTLSKIRIMCELSELGLIVEITNTFDSSAVIAKGEGIGLYNVRSRLNLVYSRNDLLTVSENEDVFKVEILLPQV